MELAAVKEPLALIVKLVVPEKASAVALVMACFTIIVTLLLTIGIQPQLQLDPLFQAPAEIVESIGHAPAAQVCAEAEFRFNTKRKKVKNR
jgi:hypothetical protein